MMCLVFRIQAHPIRGESAVLDECGGFGVTGHSQPNFLAWNHNSLATPFFPAHRGDCLPSTRRAIVDLSKKTAQDVWVMLLPSLKVEGKQLLDAKNVGEVLAYLKDRYTVLIKPIIFVSYTGQYGIGLPARFDESSCSLTEPRQTPCIIYFRQALRTTALEIRNMIRAAQLVPDERVEFVDPTKMPSLTKELLEKSGIDVIVVLSG